MDFKHKNHIIKAGALFTGKHPLSSFQHPVSFLTQFNNVVNSNFKISFHAAAAAWKHLLRLLGFVNDRF